MEKNGFPYSRFHLNQIRGVMGRWGSSKATSAHTTACVLNHTHFNKHNESFGQDDTGLDCQNYNLAVFPTTSHPCQKDIELTVVYPAGRFVL